MGAEIVTRGQTETSILSNTLIWEKREIRSAEANCITEVPLAVRDGAGPVRAPRPPGRRDCPDVTSFTRQPRLLEWSAGSPNARRWEGSGQPPWGSVFRCVECGPGWAGRCTPRESPASPTRGKVTCIFRRMATSRSPSHACTPTAPDRITSSVRPACHAPPLRQRLPQTLHALLLRCEGPELLLWVPQSPPFPLSPR